LLEISPLNLLSRGVVAIAKRIQSGRRAMIAGLSESPLTFQSILICRNERTDGKIFLRDITDLEATYAGPAAEAIPTAAEAAA
jgi:RNA polymerase primary sigma factor